MEFDDLNQMTKLLSQYLLVCKKKNYVLCVLQFYGDYNLRQYFVFAETLLICNTYYFTNNCNIYVMEHSMI